MDYINIILLAIAIFFVILFIVEKNKRENLLENSDTLIRTLRGQIQAMERAQTVANDRIRSMDTDLEATREALEKCNQDALKQNGKISKETLRFMFPDKQIAYNVKVKAVKEGDKIVRVESTVRKKVDGTFTDVPVEPVLVYSSNK